MAKLKLSQKTIDTCEKKVLDSIQHNIELVNKTLQKHKDDVRSEWSGVIR